MCEEHHTASSACESGTYYRVWRVCGAYGLGNPYRGWLTHNSPVEDGGGGGIPRGACQQEAPEGALRRPSLTAAKRSAAQSSASTQRQALPHQTARCVRHSDAQSHDTAFTMRLDRYRRVV